MGVINGPTMYIVPEASIDADAQTYLTAAGIPYTDQVFHAGTTQQRTGKQLCTYIHQYVSDLKTASVWSQLPAIFPLLETTTNSSRINLKTPGTYNIVWTASAPSAGSMGLVANSNQLGYINLAVNFNGTKNIGYFSYNQTWSGAFSAIIGCETGSTNRCYLAHADSGFNFMGCISLNNSNVAIPQPLGGFLLAARYNNLVTGLSDTASYTYSAGSTSQLTYKIGIMSAINNAGATNGVGKLAADTVVSFLGVIDNINPVDYVAIRTATKKLINRLGRTV